MSEGCLLAGCGGEGPRLLLRGTPQQQSWVHMWSVLSHAIRPGHPPASWQSVHFFSLHSFLPPPLFFLFIAAPLFGGRRLKPFIILPSSQPLLMEGTSRPQSLLLLTPNNQRQTFGTQKIFSLQNIKSTSPSAFANQNHWDFKTVVSAVTFLMPIWRHSQFLCFVCFLLVGCFLLLILYPPHLWARTGF